MSVDPVNKDHIHNLLLFFHNDNMKAIDAYKRIDQVYPNSITYRNVCHWFKKFNDGDQSLERKRGSGAKNTFDDSYLELIVKSNPTMTLTEYADLFGVTKSCISKRLKALDYTSKNTYWVPHSLSTKNKSDRVRICLQLLQKYQEANFLDWIVTGDEKWILYQNVQRKREWSKCGATPGNISKAALHPKKIMLCLWWDIHGVIYYELLPPNETINAQKYQAQLKSLKEALALKRPALLNRNKVHFHHDNARPHTARDTVALLKSYNWTVLDHPAYSPDLAPSDYYLFRSLQNALNGKNFQNKAELETFLNEFFDNKPNGYYKTGIYKLPELWKNVSENGGAYL